MKGKGRTRLAEIRDGRRGWLSWFDSSLLAGKLYREPDGDPFPLRDNGHQHHGLVLDWFCVCAIDGKNALEPELAVSDSNWFYRRIYHVL